MSSIKVMLVDDHAVVRMGFKMLLETDADIKVVAEAESGELAIQRYMEHKPNVVVMDITMPGIGGLEAFLQIFFLEHDPLLFWRQRCDVRHINIRNDPFGLD